MREIPTERLLGSKYRVYSPQYQEECFIFQEKGGGGNSGGYVAISLDSPFGKTLANYRAGDSFVFQEISYQVLEMKRPFEPTSPDDPEFDLMAPENQVGVYVKLLKERPKDCPRIIRSLLELHPSLISVDLFWTLINGQNVLGPVLLELIKEGYQEIYPSVEPYASVLRLFHLPNGTVISETVITHWSEIPLLIRYSMLVFAIRSKLRWPDLENTFHQEQVPAVKLLLALVWVSRDRESGLAIFQNFHRILKNYLIDLAWNEKTVAPINLAPLLPGCVMGKNLIHCEARIINDDTPQNAWCRDCFCNYGCLNPRQLLSPTGHNSSDSITGDSNGPMNLMFNFREIELNSAYYWEYNLYEIFRELKLIPAHELINHSEEYVTWIGGWVNRLNEIKARFNCQECNHRMTPVSDYPDDITENLIMVVQCPNQTCPSFGIQIYLGHCRSCDSLIDSRHNTRQREGKCICPKCGSGPLQP
jgi:hypothetical protein